MRKVTPKQAAAELGVTTDALRRWADEGKITVERTAGGHRRYDMDELVGVLSGIKRAEPELITIDSLDDYPAGLIPLGRIVNGEGAGQLVALQDRVLDEHLFYCGRTGSGKSELMRHLFTGVVRDGYPAVLIDPHGALSDSIINALINTNPERLDDIVLCDLSDPEFSVSFNPLAIESVEEIDSAVGAVLAMFERQLNFARSSAPRAANFLYLALAALCEANLYLDDPETKCTILHVTQFFLDRQFRQLIVSFCENISVREMFDPDYGPFEMYSDKHQAEVTYPIIRAAQELARSTAFSGVFSSGENKLDFAELIGQGKIVIIRLARLHTQQKLGEFVGALIVPHLFNSLAKWGKNYDVTTGETLGKGCRVFIDEAPRVLSPETPIEQLLAESRKADVGLIMTGQYLDQFDQHLVRAVLANTSNKLALTLDPSSSRLMAHSLQVSPEEIADLPKYQFIGRLQRLGEDQRNTSGAVRVAILPPLPSILDEEGKQARQRVIERSRKLLSRDDDAGESRVEAIKTRLTIMHSERIEEAADDSARPYIVLDLGIDDDPVFDGASKLIEAKPLTPLPSLAEAPAIDTPGSLSGLLEALYLWRRAAFESDPQEALTAAGDALHQLGVQWPVARELEHSLARYQQSPEALWALARRQPQLASLVGRLASDLAK